jgi:hypothetical protein
MILGEFISFSKLKFSDLKDEDNNRVLRVSKALNKIQKYSMFSETHHPNFSGTRLTS